MTELLKAFLPKQEANKMVKPVCLFGERNWEKLDKHVPSTYLFFLCIFFAFWHPFISIGARFGLPLHHTSLQVWQLVFLIIETLHTGASNFPNGLSICLLTVQLLHYRYHIWMMVNKCHFFKKDNKCQFNPCKLP